MAQCKLTPQEFIQNAFSPMVAVMCSPLVDQACRKNNLSFIELLQPFCKLNTEAQIRDPSGAAVTVRNLRVTVMDVNTRPPQPTLAKKFLNSSVTLASDLRTSSVQIRDYVLDIPPTVPWFEAWRETFFQVQFPSDHEFTKHFLACIIVVSSNEPNPLESLNQLLQNLTQLQTPTQTKLPKWFSANILRYFVLLHDTVEGNNDVAVKTLENFKQNHGVSNCFLLQINSRSAGLTDDQFLPDPWCQFLMRKAESTEVSESESPRTPADSGSVSVMPNSVTSDVTVIARGSTTPTLNRSIVKLEVGQEASEVVAATVTYHPLSPEVENRGVIHFEEEETMAAPINSNVWQGTASTPSVVHGACLTTDDIEQLKLLVHEFCLRSLFPYIEKQIQQISEQISNKKGVSRSLFSATKRWFTPSKPGSSGSTTAFNAVIYANDSSELQLRRLGDLYFMFGHYTMAFQAYHSAKRDFNADQAWLYYAGALEMAALAAFMCGEVTRKTCDYMEESIVTYLNTCRMPQFATRATLLSTECLKGKTQYGEAAHQFIRMTSEDSDLRSALLLEQAAYCFLNCTKPRMVRKYAFHIVLAGHRFSKCMQRKHSLRCYRQAFQVYNNKGWSLAEDHIHFTIGRQASYLKQLEEATVAFSKLLTPKSRQNAQQQTIYLKEYLNAHYLLMKDTEQSSYPILQLPLLDCNETKVLLGPQPPLTTPGRIPASGVNFVTDVHDAVFQKWNKLEEMMVQESVCPQPLIFKPMVTFYSSKNSSSTKPIAVKGEPVQISILLQNTLQIILALKNIYLLWRFTGKDGENTFVIKNECADEVKTDKFIRTHCLKFANLQPNCKEELILSVTPLVVGELVIEGVFYTIVNTSVQESNIGVTGKQMFNIRGPRLKTKEKEGQPVYAPDRRLEISVAPSAPCLQVGFSEISQELLVNELQNVNIELRNCGSTPLHKIMMASSMPQLFSLATTEVSYYVHNKVDDITSENPNIRDKDNRKTHTVQIILPEHFNNRLEPGQSHIINLWLRAPSDKGPSLVDLLFYYENVNTQCVPRYRLVRHLWHLVIQDSLETEINARHSCGCNNVETLTLCLRATNSNQVHHAVVSEIRLVQASLISNNWKLCNDIILPTDVKLHCQESVHLLLKAFRSVTKTDTTNYSKIMFSKNNKLNTTDIQQAGWDFAKRSFSQDLNVFLTSGENVDDSNHSMEAMLIVGWQAIVTDSAGNKRVVIGQHHLPIKKLSKVPNIEKELTSNGSFAVNCTVEQISLKPDVSAITVLQKQVTYNMAHPAMFQHDFTYNRLCIVPVQIILHSSAGTSLVVKVNTLGTSSTTAVNLPKNELSSPNSSNHFRWIGHSEFLCSMEPFSSHTLSLNVAFSAPGTYDLGGRVEILCRPPDHPYDTVMQNCRIHSAIVVKDIREN